MDPLEQILNDVKSLVKPPGRPLVTLSYAQSLDGSVAGRRGSPLAISEPESLVLTHRLRAAHDSILVGVGTVIADNPRLTVRLVEGVDPQPLVLDSRLRFPLDAALLQGCSPWIATTEQADPQKAAALEERGASLIGFPAAADGRVDLPALLARLDEIGVRSVMVEGGISVITSFLASQLVDALVLTVAPLFIGGVHALERSLAKGEVSSKARGGGASPECFPRLGEMSAAKIGADLIVWGLPVWP